MSKRRLTLSKIEDDLANVAFSLKVIVVSTASVNGERLLIEQSVDVCMTSCFDFAVTKQ